MAVEVTELVTRFGFQGTLAPLGKYNLRLGKSIGLLAGLTAGLGIATVAFNKWASSVLQSLDPMVQLSRETKVAVGWIQEMGFAASQNGSDLQAVQSTIGSLSQKIGEAAQKGSEDFARLGISVRDASGQVKSADLILDEVRQRFRQLNLSMEEQRSFASALGIDSSLLQLLNRTSSELNGLRARARELGTLTREQADSAVEYNDALAAMRFGLDAVKRLIAVGVAPQLTEMAENFTNLLAANKDWIVNGVRATVEFISELFAALGRLAPFLATLAGGFGILKIATLGWGGALALVFSPVTLITAAIIAVLAILDDLIVAFNGGESVIRDFFLAWLGWDIVPFLHGIAAAFKELVALVVALFKGDFSGAWEIFKRIGAQAIEGFKILFRDLFTWVNDKFFGVLDSIKQAFRDLIGWVTDGLKSIGSFFGFGDDANPLAGETQLSDGTLLPGEIPSVPGATNDNRKVEQTNYFEIRTNDPERAGQAVGDNLQRQLDDAQTQFNRGGR